MGGVNFCGLGRMLKLGAVQDWDSTLGGGDTGVEIELWSWDRMQWGGDAGFGSNSEIGGRLAGWRKRAGEVVLASALESVRTR